MTKAARHYRELIGGYTAIDLGRVWGGVAVGLRDGAVLALLSAGLTPVEVSRLEGRSLVEAGGGRVKVYLRRGAWLRDVVLDAVQSARVVAWVAESETWGRERLVFGLTRQAVRRVVVRYTGRKGDKR